MSSSTYPVTGMTCAHCVASVQVEGHDRSADAVRAVVEAAGGAVVP